MKSFKEKVRNFYKDGDEAHLIDHADDVCDLALEINQELAQFRRLADEITVERVLEICEKKS